MSFYNVVDIYTNRIVGKVYAKNINDAVNEWLKSNGHPVTKENIDKLTADKI